MTLCAVTGCRRAAVKKGYCNAHYLRQWRHGDPLCGRAFEGDPIQWLRDHVDHEGSECLLWPFDRSKHGYGNVRYEGRSQIASRIMCRFAHGEPPPGKPWALHSCHTPMCCHPGHLRWGTEVENAADRRGDGTAMLGEEHPGARMNDTTVRAVRASSERTSDLARRYGVSVGCISAIRKRVTWRHI